MNLLIALNNINPLKDCLKPLLTLLHLLIIALLRYLNRSLEVKVGIAELRQKDKMPDEFLEQTLFAQLEGLPVNGIAE